MNAVIIVLLALAVLAPSQAFGQGTISGTVTDARRSALPGVSVRAGGVPDRARTVVTDAAGRYEIAELPAGSYILTFTLSGFRVVTREDVVVADGTATTVDATLRVAPLDDVIIVPPRQPDADDRTCLHGRGETPSDRMRREEALAAMRLIADVLGGLPIGAATPSWEDLARSSAVTRLLAESGARGDLARRIRWGASEPLPGWGMAWVASGVVPRYALTDLRDPCGFTLSSRDPRVVPQQRYSVVPLS